VRVSFIPSSSTVLVTKTSPHYYQTLKSAGSSPPKSFSTSPLSDSVGVRCATHPKYSGFYEPATYGIACSFRCIALTCNVLSEASLNMQRPRLPCPGVALSKSKNKKRRITYPVSKCVFSYFPQGHITLSRASRSSCSAAFAPSSRSHHMVAFVMGA